MTMAQKK